MIQGIILEEMLMKPTIAITSAYADNRITLSQAYANATELCGGVPIILPYYDCEESYASVVNSCDGFIFSGGPDVHPKYYGEDVEKKCGRIDLCRDSFELKLLRRALGSGKPILAICRGAQLVNIGLHGSLYQDIDAHLRTNISHVQSEGTDEYSHSVDIVLGSPLYKLMGKSKASVNSFHHQAVKIMGDGLRTSSLSPDGITESFYYDGPQYIRGYQWHPELLVDKDELSRMIFTDFINNSKRKT